MDPKTGPEELPTNTGRTPGTDKPGASDPSTWLDRYGDGLYRYAFARLRNHTLAEEAVQETLLGALQGIDSFAGRSSERTWLFAILKRKLVDAIRKLQRERPVGDVHNGDSSDDVLDSLFQKKGSWKRPPSGWVPDPSALAEESEFWGVLSTCLENLPERTAQAFTLRVLDGAEAEDICKLLSVKPNHLWVLLHRARTRLRQCLEVNWFETTTEDGN